jgi:fructan beta-fructosidase
MTLPRELTLSKTNNQYVLKSTAVEQLKKQMVSAFSKKLITTNLDQKTTLNYAFLNQSQLSFNAKNEDLKLVFSNKTKDSLVLNYDAKQKIFSVDRRHSGIVNFEKNFGKEIHSTPVSNIISETIDYQIILDWSSIEIFLNGGIYTFTEQIFPKKPYTKLSIQSNESQDIKNITIHKIKGVW